MNLKSSIQSALAFRLVMFSLVVALLSALPGFLLANDTTEKPGNHKVESVSNFPHSRIAEYSDRIDALVEQQLVEKGEKRNAPVSDKIFLRRIYLDIGGRIPTIEETKNFLQSRSETKRADLIDDLLDSYAYTSRQFNFFADLLRIKTRIRRVGSQPYIDFIKDSLEQNKPYDDLVRELLVAEGPMFKEGNGAVGYYLRDLNMPEDNMSNTVRAFLGTRLECAQCHDHPFDKWTQRQYFEMVAFTGGMQFRTRTPDSKNAKDLVALLRDRSVEPETRRVLRQILEPMTYGVYGGGTSLARLPEGFMGDDGKEFEVIRGKTMFGEESLVDAEVPSSRKRESQRAVKRRPQVIRGAKDVNSREIYADWLTRHDTPRFSTVIANRLWKQAMGVALITPIDVIDDNTVASNPALMTYLADSMAELDFDMKQYLRAIYNSRTYQSAATGTDVAEPHKYNFNGPIVRRMTAEQIWDSLLTMSIPEVDQRVTSRARVGYITAKDPDDSVYDLYKKIQDMSADELLEMAEERIAARNGDRDKMRSEMMEMEREKRSKIATEVREFRRKHTKELRKAKKENDEKRIRELMVERNEFMANFKRRRNTKSVRASEVASPAPAGHFLREFGQSDREEIDNANSDPAVTQVLSLMNGLLERNIASNPNTVLMKNIYEAKTGERIDAVYLTMLNRPATRQEERGWTQDFRNNPKEMLADLIWTLANSNEFLFVK